MTANTVTYATTGDLLGYWDFFPTGHPGWSRVPAIRCAEVVESQHPEIAVGGRQCGGFGARRLRQRVQDSGPRLAAGAALAGRDGRCVNVARGARRARPRPTWATSSRYGIEAAR